MIAGLIGLLGVALGAGTTAGVAWWSRRDDARRQARVVARLMPGEASAFRAQLAEARERRRVLPDIDKRCELFLEAWRNYPDELSVLPAETWWFLTAWVHALSAVAITAKFEADEAWGERTDALYAHIQAALEPAEEILERSEGRRRPLRHGAAQRRI